MVPEFKFLTRVAVVNHTFLGGHIGTIIAHDPHYGTYTVQFTRGLVKEVNGQYLKALSKAKRSGGKR